MTVIFPFRLRSALLPSLLALLLASCKPPETEMTLRLSPWERHQTVTQQDQEHLQEKLRSRFKEAGHEVLEWKPDGLSSVQLRVAGEMEHAAAEQVVGSPLVQVVGVMGRSQAFGELQTLEELMPAYLAAHPEQARHPFPAEADTTDPAFRKHMEEHPLISRLTLPLMSHDMKISDPFWKASEVVYMQPSDTAWLAAFLRDKQVELRMGNKVKFAIVEPRDTSAKGLMALVGWVPANHLSWHLNNQDISEIKPQDGRLRVMLYPASQTLLGPLISGGIHDRLGLMVDGRLASDDLTPACVRDMELSLPMPSANQEEWAALLARQLPARVSLADFKHSH